MLYAEKNVTKAHTLLYTAVHGPPFDARNNITSHFVIKQAVKLEPPL